MLSRGKLVGDIVDGLGQLSFVLQTRSKLGLFDLNKYSEDFIKELLNIIYGYSLVNLNVTRSNEPGLDLGDEINKLGVQVTTDKRSAKVNHTLEKITGEQQARYNRFVILILGSKQNSYSGINSQVASNLQFSSKDDIWDFSDLERAILNLPHEKIKEVYDLLQSDLLRLFSDLDVGSTPSGEETTILNRVEQRPTIQYNGCASIVAHINEKHGVQLAPQEMEGAFQNLYARLTELPRITREFFFALLSRSEFIENRGVYGVRDLLIRRIINISTTKFSEELKLLEAYNLVGIVDLDERDYWIMFQGVCSEENCLVELMEYIQDKSYDLKEIFVDLNFSCIG